MRNNIIIEMLENKKQAGVMFTQYERFGRITESEIKEYIADETELTILEHLEAFNDYLAGNDESVYSPMTELNEFLDGFTGSEGFRMTFFGKVCLSDDYFTLNAYGNVESVTEWELLERMKRESDFINELANGIFEELTEDETKELIEAGNLALAAGW